MIVKTLDLYLPSFNLFNIVDAINLTTFVDYVVVSFYQEMMNF